MSSDGAVGNTCRTSTIMSGKEVIVSCDELHEKMTRIGGEAREGFVYVTLKESLCRCWLHIGCRL